LDEKATGEGTGEATSQDTVSHPYPSASWRMHHPAAFSTVLFHSGGVSHILRFT